MLCRHCRCLFWKSFGHPCIKNEDLHTKVTDQHCSGFRSPFEHSCSEVNNGCNCDGLCRQHGHLEGSILERVDQSRARNEHNEGDREEVQGRVSVATLSRNFDERAQRLDRAVFELENIAPSQQGEANSHDSRSNFEHQQNQRRPFQSSNDENSNRAREIRELSARFNNRQRQYENNYSRNNISDNNQRSAQVRPAPVALRHDELVPKHVAISPQAFLKFFSL